MSNPKVSILINNFNYEEFVIDAIESALHQDYINKEIIVVDDGSTDQSVVKIKKHPSFSLIKLIEKQNGGQLSAINEGMKYAAGDIIFFLDSDDTWHENYISEAIAFYKKNKDCDFLISGKSLSNGDPSNIDEKIYPCYSYFITKYKRAWLGDVTSTLSCRAKILLKFLPLSSIEADWITRADDLIVWGASLVGAKKYHLNKCFVNYRIHSNNNYYGKENSDKLSFKREASIAVATSIICDSYPIKETKKLFYTEMLDSKLPAKKYLRICLKSNLGIQDKFNLFFLIIYHKLFSINKN